MGSLTLITPPTSEPVSVEEVKANSRIVTSADDSLILQLIKAAVNHTEGYLQRRLITQTWEWRTDKFHYPEMDLPIGPISAVNSITYVDMGGTTQTMSASDYAVDSYSEPPRIRPAYQKIWPITRWVMNAVTVQMIVGYGTKTDVPKPIREALLMLVDHWYEHRGSVTELTLAETPQAWRALLLPYRMHIRSC